MNELTFEGCDEYGAFIFRCVCGKELPRLGSILYGSRCPVTACNTRHYPGDLADAINRAVRGGKEE